MSEKIEKGFLVRGDLGHQDGIHVPVTDFLLYLQLHSSRQYYYSHTCQKHREENTRTTLSLVLITILVAVTVGSLPHRAEAQTLQPHNPIVITGNSGFSSCDCVTGGNGAPDNPWIISGWEITSVSATLEGRPAISMSNTNSHFIIRDVYIHPATLVSESSGVYFISVQNGRLENSNITNTSYGIWMSLSSFSVITDNTFWGITRTSIYVIGGTDNTVSKNRISSNFPGIGAPLIPDPRIKFVDANSDSNWTPRAATRPEEPVVYDTDDSNTYNLGETLIFGATPSDGTTLKFDPKIRLFDFNNDGAWDPGDSVVQDSFSTGVYNSGESVLSYLTPEGMRISSVSQTTIVDNSINNMDTGFLVANSQNSFIDRNTLANVTNYGFRITSHTTGTSFRNNTIVRTSYGLVFDNSDHNIARGNMIFRGDYGIGLEGLSGPNTAISITRNTLVDNRYGVYTLDSDFNFIYDNYMDNTVADAFESQDSQNFWNTTKTLATNILGGPFLGGNFYKDYTGVDQDGDGIGDSSFNIQSQAVDRLPLVQQQPSIVHDVSVTRVTAKPPSVLPDNSFTLIVSVFNQGTVEETFTVTTYHELTILNTTDLTLPPWTPFSYSFLWNSGLPTGTYQVTARATTVPGEQDTADNTSPAAQATVNTPPTASFTITPQAPTASLPASFDASQSNDPDGTLVSYVWDFGDGQTANGPTAVHIYTVAGPFTLTLTVTDNLGGTSALTRGITVTPTPNQEPVAEFSVDPASPQVSQQTTFDASSSNDPDGTISTYAWDFGDGQTGTGTIVTHTYLTSGPYMVKLQVTDNVGATSSTTHDITVTASRPTAPTLQLTSGPDKITLTWSTPSSDGGSPISQYRIYRGLSSSSLTLLATVSANVNTYEDRAVLRGETYYYQVSAVNQAGREGDLSAEESGQSTSSPNSSPLNDPIVMAALAAVVTAVAVAGAVLFLRRPRQNMNPGRK